jgi:phage anti-repressor protein
MEEKMSNELIKLEPVKIDGKDVFCINARDVHARLGVGRRFNTWIKGRIEEYGFVEGRDFVVSSSSGEGGFSQNGEKPLGGRPSIEYMLTGDMALGLAAIEGGARALKFIRDFKAAVEAAAAPVYIPVSPTAEDLLMRRMN